MNNKDRIFYYGQQQDERWHKLRLGKFTSSTIHLLMQEPRTKKQKEEWFFSEQGIKLIREKAKELFYKRPGKIVFSAALDWGNEQEPIAQEEFWKVTDLQRNERKICFVEIDGAETGSSPDDTDISQEIPIEYKNPYNEGIHLDHLELRTGKDLFSYSKQKYMQLQHQMFILSQDKHSHGFFVSYDERLKNIRPKKALHFFPVKKNIEIHEQFEERIEKAVKLRDFFLQKWLADE